MTEQTRSEKVDRYMVPFAILVGVAIALAAIGTMFDPFGRPSAVVPKQGLMVMACDAQTFFPGKVIGNIAEPARLDRHTQSSGCDPIRPLELGEPRPVSFAGLRVAGQVCNLSGESIAYNVTVVWDAVQPGEPDVEVLDTDIVYPPGCIRPYDVTWGIPEEVAALRGRYEYRIVGRATPTDLDRWTVYQWTSIPSFQFEN